MGKFKKGDVLLPLDSKRDEIVEHWNKCWRHAHGELVTIYMVGGESSYPRISNKVDGGGPFWPADFFKASPTITIEPGKHYRLRNGKVTGRVSTGDIGFEALVDGQLKVFDKAGGAVFGGEDIVEAWVPKVGERVRFVENYGYAKAGDEATITGFWSDLVMLDVKGTQHSCYPFRIEPLLVAAPAQQAALKIEAGRYYKTRDGRKVGPMVSAAGRGFDKEYPFTVDHDIEGLRCGKAWRADGSFSINKSLENDADLIAEWIDEPVAVANDNAAPAKPKFKVGDRVKVLTSDWPHIISVGSITNVVGVDDDGILLWAKDYDSGLYFFHREVAEAPTTQPTAIVALIEDGQPRPSANPFVHATEAAAGKEAARLAGIHKGKQFGVYVLASTSQEAAPTYKHEWQRLAAKGEKINAIKELRSVTGMQLKPAKDVVEHFIDYPYGQLAA